MTIRLQDSTALKEKATEKVRRSPPPSFQLIEDECEKTDRVFPDFEEVALGALKEVLDEEKLLIEGMPLPPVLPLQSQIPTYFAISALRGVEIVPELADFFEKSVNAMAHITIAGVSETTFYLDTPQFSGAKIVITEFNTAPKSFNITIVGAPEIARLFSVHASDLIAAFQKSPYNFNVHRLESEIDLYAFHRKEELSDQNEDEESQ